MDFSGVNTDVIQWVDLKTIVSFFGFVISVLVYKHNRQQSLESWIKYYFDLYNKFWDDEDFLSVRSYLANDKSYEKLRAALLKRKESNDLADEDQRTLEQLDKFLGLTYRALIINPSLSSKYKKFSQVVDTYWIERILSGDREEIRWYVKTFYPETWEFFCEVEK